ncbi:alpha/beta hydrolase [Coralliovum pocilloporae]|uniref:alpha/beta hydrolase n=1 Tax=Coralliovum pocilloporae TaxID=3066369 RepID=UPI003307AB51
MTLIETDTNPIPEGVTSGFVETTDGYSIRYARWPARGTGARGTVCLMQGRAEFIEKYFETVESFRDRGYAVITFDWRGQGGSQRILKNPRKGYVDDISDYHRDLDAVMQNVILPDCPPPLYAVAHSTGGLALLTVLRKRPNWFERVILSAPLLQVYSRPFRPWISTPLRFLNPLVAPFRALAKAVTSPATMARVAAFLTYFGFGEFYVPGGSGRGMEEGAFDGRILTSDTERLQRMIDVLRKDRSLGLGSPTIAWLYAVLRAMRLPPDPDFHIPIHVPILMIGAGRDRVVSARAIERLAVVMRSASYVEIPGSAHEIMMERDLYREQFFALFDAFVTNAETGFDEGKTIGF